MPHRFRTWRTREEGSFGFETTLRYVNETRSLAIERFVLSESNQSVLAAEISSEEQLTEATPTYLVQAKGNTNHTVELTFSGLFPRSDGFDGKIREQLDDVLGFFRAAL